MKTHNISLWGAADLREFSTPTDATGQKFPIAISWAIPMNPQIMFSIQKGHNCGICSAVCPYGLKVLKSNFK
jgi:ferredoxin